MLWNHTWPFITRRWNISNWYSISKDIIDKYSRITRTEYKPYFFDRSVKSVVLWGERVWSTWLVLWYHNFIYFFVLIEVKIFTLHSEEFRMHPEMACKLDVTFLLQFLFYQWRKAQTKMCKTYSFIGSHFEDVRYCDVRF